MEARSIFLVAAFAGFACGPRLPPPNHDTSWHPERYAHLTRREPRTSSVAASARRPPEPHEPQSSTSSTTGGGRKYDDAEMATWADVHYDEFKDRTFALKAIKVDVGRNDVAAELQFIASWDGKKCCDDLLVLIGFSTRASSFVYGAAEEPEFLTLVDGSRVRICTMERMESRVAKYPVSIIEHFKCEVRPEFFSRLGAAKEVRAQIGRLEFTIAPKTIRDFGLSVHRH